jgi:hypothetical protein
MEEREVNTGLERMYKKVVIVKFEVFPRHSNGGTEKE